MTVHARYSLARPYLDLATDGPNGRPEISDDIYRAITESRDTGKVYSSCGDLCHWLLFRLGVRQPWVNRLEHQGWRPGKNISDLVFKCPIARAPYDAERFQLGDILAIWNRADGTDAHVLVVIEHVGKTVRSADYGQPGGMQRSRILEGDGMLNGRLVQRVLPVFDLLSIEHKAGRLAPVQSVDEWLSSVAPRSVRTRPTLYLGSRGEAVFDLQRLIGLVTVDGDFGPKTEQRVKALQIKHGLVSDGVVGPKTWKALGQ